MSKQLSKKDLDKINEAKQRLRFGIITPETKFEKVAQRDRRREFVRELWESGFGTDVIAQVCGVARSTVCEDLNHIEEQIRQSVDPQWAARRFVVALHKLKRHAEWAENRSVQAETDESAINYRSMAMRAERDQAELLIKIAQAAEIKKWLTGDKGSEGDPTNIEDVFAKLARERIEKARLIDEQQADSQAIDNAEIVGDENSR